MICRRCAVRLGASRPSVSTYLAPALQQLRFGSGATTPARGPDSGSHEGPPAATSTQAAQPFSNPLTPAKDPDALGKPGAAPERPKSSVPAGMMMKGLGFMKNRDPPAAMEDHEYPDWLWELLDEDKKSSTGSAEGADGDAYAKSKKQRRIASKAARKAAKLNTGYEPVKVPLEHQSIDLPAGDGTTDGSIQAAGARKELTQALRNQRRKGIKEGNFLKSM